MRRSGVDFHLFTYTWSFLMRDDLGGAREWGGLFGTRRRARRLYPADFVESYEPRFSIRRNKSTVSAGKSPDDWPKLMSHIKLLPMTENTAKLVACAVRWQGVEQGDLVIKGVNMSWWGGTIVPTHTFLSSWVRAAGDCNMHFLTWDYTLLIDVETLNRFLFDFYCFAWRTVYFSLCKLVVSRKFWSGNNIYHRN